MSNDNPKRRIKKGYIEITEEELKQIACNKAKGEFGDKYNRIESSDDITIKRQLWKIL